MNNIIALPESKRVLLVVGGYGSGKTEVAMNLGREIARAHQPTAIVDLDIVNPYFRSREQRVILEQQGLVVIAPEGAVAATDLPALPPQVYGPLENSDYRVVFDVGGDDVGARALGLYHGRIPENEYDLWMVVNQSRPMTNTPEKVITLIRAIEEKCRLTVTGLINNTHMLHLTDADTVVAGQALADDVARQTGLPVICSTVVESVIPTLPADFTTPVFPIRLYMLADWRRDC
jgi:hypothetical protein